MTYDLHMPLVLLPTSQSMLASIILVCPFSRKLDLKGSEPELEGGCSGNRHLRRFLGFVFVLVCFFSGTFFCLFCFVSFFTQISYLENLGNLSLL